MESAAERLVKSSRGFFLEDEPSFASLSAFFIPAVPPCPGVQTTETLMSLRAVKTSWKLDRKSMDASWEGWGEPSKIFSMAEDASKKIRTWVMLWLDKTVLLMMEEACPRAYISAS